MKKYFIIGFGLVCLFIISGINIIMLISSLIHVCIHDWDSIIMMMDNTMDVNAIEFKDLFINKRYLLSFLGYEPNSLYLAYFI